MSRVGCNLFIINKYTIFFLQIHKTGHLINNLKMNKSVKKRLFLCQQNKQIIIT